MNRIAPWLAMLVIVAAVNRAEAVPSTVSFTGRLTTSSGPVTGAINLTFRLYDVATGGTALWTEVRNGVGAANGLVFLDLGQATPLDSSVFTGARLYLEVDVGSETLTPRIAMNSVPYAMRTADADRLGGIITSADVITSAVGTNGITATKNGNMLGVSLTTAGCASGQVYRYNGSNFECANVAPTAGDGIAVSGTTVSLSTTGCSSGSVWRYTGAAWQCATDDDVVGNEITAATDASLVRSGSGTGASPYTLGLNTAHANTWTATQTFGDVVIGGNADVGWARVTGTPANFTGAGNCVNWNVEGCNTAAATASCPANMRLLGGGCSASFANARDINISRSAPSSDTTWSCHASSYANAGAGTLTAHAICARM